MTNCSLMWISGETAFRSRGFQARIQNNSSDATFRSWGSRARIQKITFQPLRAADGFALRKDFFVLPKTFFFLVLCYLQVYIYIHMCVCVFAISLAWATSARLDFRCALGSNSIVAVS